MTLEQAKNSIGRKVIYTPFKGSTEVEVGVITSVNNRYVFVRYENDVNSKATDPNDIELEFSK